MKNFSSVHIGKATKDYNKFDLSHDHLTTTDFGQLSVNCVVDNVIGDKVTIDVNQFTRVAPMTFPTYGEVGQRLVSCFVPYYLIADDADSYISGLQVHAGKTVKARLIDQQVLNSIIWGKYMWASLNHSYLKVSRSGTIDDIDGTNFVYISYANNDYSQPRYTVYEPTARGRYLIKLLTQLGYQVDRVLDANRNNNNGNDHSINAHLELNAYPLLCLLKAYADLLLPNTYYQTSSLLTYLEKVKIGDDSTILDTKGRLLHFPLIEVLENFATVFYDADYFTTAWQSPNSPLSSIQTSNVSLDASPNVKLHSNSNNNYVELESHQISNTVTKPALTAFQLNFLQSFDKFVRRNNLVGYREYNAIYARFGLKPSEMKSQYCQVIDIRNMNLSVGDVTSTAGSETDMLGSYAGKGFINGGTKITYEAKDYGMFIMFSHLFVKPIYFQGTRKHCLRNNYLDFYQPEFDGIGPQPISKVELDMSSGNSVFGFTERYNDYRFMQSHVTGDFVEDPLMWPWHTGRYFGFRNLPVAQSDNMLMYVPDENGNFEYDRIFAVTSDDETHQHDHFYQVWHFNINAMRPMLNINQAVNLGVGNIQLDRNGAV